MIKPPCQKCGSTSVYLEPARMYNDEPSIACYVCGWRCYGESNIKSLILAYNKGLEEKKKKEKQLEALRKKAVLDMEREREERLQLREASQKAAQEEEKRMEELRAQEGGKIPGYDFMVGDVDPVLHMPWAAPDVPGDQPACGWPPCGERARPTSKYCSRKCTVRVARQRDKLRKKGMLAPKKKKKAS